MEYILYTLVIILCLVLFELVRHIYKNETINLRRKEDSLYEGPVKAPKDKVNSS